MATPGFTAEDSLSRGTEHYRQTRWAPGGAGERLRMAQLGLLDLPPLVQPVQPVRTAELISEIRYGNWCGNAYGSGVPEDKVDQVCCRHDKCYCERGDLDCSCDRDLLADMPGAIADPSTPAEGRLAGAAFMAFFAADPFCLCHQVLVPRVGWPPWRWATAPFPVPGIPPLKTCPFPYR
jgi:Phospholipase A2